MKVIDLLNKISNGEEVPRKFIYNGYLWEYDVRNKMWFYYFGENNNHRFDRLFYLNMILNDEVEIIDSEEWKTIKDFPNYEISTKGNIRTKEYVDDKGHKRHSKLLNKQINNCGYEYVILSNEFLKHKTLTVHRLLAKTFLDDYYDTLDVNHINGIKTDNRLCNIEMVNHSENVKKRYEIGNDGNNYKAVEQYDLDGNYIATYKSSYEAEKMTGIGRTCIGGCCRKEHNTAGGYIWKFKKIEENNKIEKLVLDYAPDIEEKIFYDNGDKPNHCIVGDAGTQLIIKKINQIIDVINEIKNGQN